jgi:hypothetical protein
MPWALWPVCCGSSCIDAVGCSSVSVWLLAGGYDEWPNCPLLACSPGAGCAGLVCMLSSTQNATQPAGSNYRIVAASKCLALTFHALVCLAASDFRRVFWSASVCWQRLCAAWRLYWLLGLPLCESAVVSGVLLNSSTCFAALFIWPSIYRVRS